MNWFKKKPSGNTSVPQREALVDLDAMSSEEHIMAAENVMACRDLANMLLNIIDDHRDNGHECLPYCIPTELHEELEDLDHFELKMLVTVMLKDMYNVYLRIKTEHLGPESS